MCGYLSFEMVLEARDRPFNKIKEMLLIAIDHGSTNKIASATASLKGLNENVVNGSG
jgi:hypothetical protein